MNGFRGDKIPMTSHPNEAVYWYMNEITHRIVAESGNPNDRYHLGKIILQSLKEDPGFILQIDGATGKSENFSSVLKRTVQCANGLRRLGAKAGDVMILMTPNHLDSAIPFYAALYLGVTVAPIDGMLKVSELEDMFLIDKPKIIFCQNERVLDVMEAANKTDTKADIITFNKGNKMLCLDDLLKKYGNNVSVEDFRPSEFDPAKTIAVLVCTSGTTGKPKSGAISHASFGISLPNLWAMYTKFPTPTRMALIVSVLQWMTAIMHYLLSPIMRYTRLQSSLPITQKHAYDLINKYKPTYMILSPTLMTTLVKSGDRDKCDFTCFETIIVGGSAVHKDLIAEVKKITPRTQVFEGYGSSEATTMAFQVIDPPPGSCGKPSGIFQYRLVDPITGEDINEPNVHGELRIQSPALFSGYFNDPQATKDTFEDGWFKTGDIFYRDENWNFFFVDRLKQLLKYKNHQISPVEVEGVFKKHPSVLDAAVVGLPDPECGELAVACVVRKPGHSLHAHEIKNLVKETLTDTKQLRGGVIFMSELPTTSTSKIHRQKLIEIVLSAHRE